jgi:PAS domain S-box-containing protein
MTEVLSRLSGNLEAHLMKVAAPALQNNEGAESVARPTGEEWSYLSTAPATPNDWRLAIAAIIFSFLVFIGAVPFARVPLLTVPAFIPCYEAALTIIDTITALLLFAQFTRLRSWALLLLACGYLFDALIVIPHALTFPGAFAPNGLLGAGLQSTAWLYMFWHSVFPGMVIAYAVLKNANDPALSRRWTNRNVLLAAVCCVAAAVVGFTVWATAGIEVLPSIMAGNGYKPFLVLVVLTVWIVALIALVALWRIKRHTVLDAWLMVVMCAWLFDVALSAGLNGERFDLGFYAGRIYGLLAASFVLAVLLLETNWLHDRLVLARGQLANRARDLEASVRKRTDELWLSNKALKTEIAERSAAEQQLSGTRLFLDAIIESLPAMLMVKEAKTGKIVYLNRAGEELTGIDRAEIVGKDVHDVMQNTDADFIALHDEKTLTSGKPCEIFESTLRTRKLGVRHVRTKKVAVPDEHGVAEYLLTFCDDITEQRQTEEQLRHAQKMEALGQLTGGLAHDFNNLLAIIIGNLDVLEELEANNAEHAELIGAAVSAALSGSELTRRLLAFARRQPLQPEQTDVNRLLEELTHLLRRTLGENIEIALELEPNIPRVTVDRVQLETAIANLANNARDAMPNGGRLVVASRNGYLDQDYAKQHAEVVPGNYVVIEVTDSGHGMAPEVLSHIFEPFYTTKEPGKGTGLGLSMVFGFMKQSGGHINVYSEPGRGTTFRLYLRAPATSTTVDVLEEAAPPLQPEAPAKSTILVVEDNRNLREIVVKQLRGLGLEVFEADNAKRALDILAVQRSVDLLFTDVVLPGEMDGCALAREITALVPRAKVLFTSGFPGARLTDIQGVGTSMRLLSKPYRKDELTRAVREVLASSK